MALIPKDEVRAWFLMKVGMAVIVIALTAHLGEFLSGVNGPR
ncbi:MAG: hypothetical protein ABSD63_08800 [Candidatus Korobacteraceae bacterium]